MKWIQHNFLKSLTYHPVVMPFRNTELGQHWLRYWLVAWGHQAITWSHVDLSSVRSSVNHLQAISQEIVLFRHQSKISLKITYKIFHSNLFPRGQWVNSLSDAYLHQYNTPTLLQIKACRLFGTKPLSEPMLPYCQLDPKEHTSVKFYFEFKCFHSRKCTSKRRLRNGSHFVSTC